MLYRVVHRFFRAPFIPSAHGPAASLTSEVKATWPGNARFNFFSATCADVDVGSCAWDVKGADAKKPCWLIFEIMCMCFFLMDIGFTGLIFCGSYTGYVLFLCVEHGIKNRCMLYGLISWIRSKLEGCRMAALLPKVGVLVG